MPRHDSKNVAGAGLLCGLSCAGRLAPARGSPAAAGTGPFPSLHKVSGPFWLRDSYPAALRILGGWPE
jgi:hypothetical protein